MNHQEFLELLQEEDDAIYTEWPNGYSLNTYTTAQNRFQQFAANSLNLLQLTLEIESGSDIQDASFHGQIRFPVQAIHSPDEDIPSFRASNFGGFATIFGENNIKEHYLAPFKALVHEHSYILVPENILELPYTGKNPGVSGFHNWGHRFFDWI